MAKYHVEIGYRTKRGGVALGMTVDALEPDEAEDKGREIALKGKPARKFCYCIVEELSHA